MSEDMVEIEPLLDKLRGWAESAAPSWCRDAEKRIVLLLGVQFAQRGPVEEFGWYVDCKCMQGCPESQAAWEKENGPILPRFTLSEGSRRSLPREVLLYALVERWFVDDELTMKEELRKMVEGK